METFTDEIIRDLLASSMKTAGINATGWHDTREGPGATKGNYIDWLTISYNAGSVIEDVERISNHPLVPHDIAVYGYIYAVKTGKLAEVPEASRLGKAA